MKLKKDRGRFTVRFDMENPDHVRAVEMCIRDRFYEPTKEAMQVSTYLRVYRRYPKLIEHLVKVGFEHIVADIVLSLIHI